MNLVLIKLGCITTGGVSNRILKIGYNIIEVSMKTLIAILNIAIGFLFFTVELYAQEKKDDKRLDISYYLGTGGRGSENRYGSTFEVPSVGMGLEYFLTP